MFKLTPIFFKALSNLTLSCLNHMMKTFTTKLFSHAVYKRIFNNFQRVIIQMLGRTELIYLADKEQGKNLNFFLIFKNNNK